MSPRLAQTAAVLATSTSSPGRHQRRRSRYGRSRWVLLALGATMLVLVGPAAGVALAEPAFAGSAPLAAVDVHAQGLVLAQPQSVDAVLTNVRDWIMRIAAALATVFVTIGAVRYMAAGGDLGEVEKAKTAFKSAAYGYALALLTPLVLTVLRELVGVR